MGVDSVLVEEHDRIATVTFNRPHRLNALDGAAVALLRDRLIELAGQPQVRAVVLTGAGRGFCAGGDVAAMTRGAGDPTASPSDIRKLMQIAELLHDMPKATIAAVNGPCAGAGLGFAAACDLRFAAPSAVFAGAFLQVGVPGDHGAIWSVTRAVGPARARGIFLLGERFGTVEAERFGLVHAIVPNVELLDYAQRVAAGLAAMSPRALAAMKDNLNDAIVLPLDAYLDREVARFVEVSASLEAKEAALAFLEKRAAMFGDN